MKEEQFNEFLQDEDKKVDYKTIVFEYLLYWPVILAFLVVKHRFIASVPRF